MNVSFLNSNRIHTFFHSLNCLFLILTFFKFIFTYLLIYLIYLIYLCYAFFMQIYYDYGDFLLLMLAFFGMDDHLKVLLFSNSKLN